MFKAAAGVLLMALIGLQDSAAAEPGIAPFSAHYVAEWRGIHVGVSDLELKADGSPDRFVYVWRISARGIFRLAYSSDVVQTSWFTMSGGHVRPDRYRAEDGSSRVSLEFDWDDHHARGASEGKPIDLKIRDGIQDVMSIQVEVMQDLKNGDLPKGFLIVDKDEAKEFTYTNQGAARIKSALGDLDTVVVASSRAGSNRVLRMWFAPSLGFIPVQAERTRDGSLEFAIRIRSLKR
ncbi:MAG: DUF3108 domain-containing protein [Steroidobacteraceae bacterium]|jgi:hypothetical protein